MDDYMRAGGELLDPRSLSDCEVREEAPLVEKRAGNVSSTRTLMNLLRGMIGSGCLALPVAFKQAGLWTGMFLVFAIGFLNTHCMMMLVYSAQYLCDNYFTNAVVAVYQLGVCAVLFVFMAAHIKQVFEFYEFPPDHQLHTGVSVRIYLCIILLPVILINFIRQLKVLALLSTGGNFLMLVAFAIIFQDLVRPPNQIANLPSFTNFASLILGLGSILYAFEGQAMILPMENKMKRPQAMVGWNGVLSTGMAIVTCIYAATGWFGYASYGEEVLGSIVLNLPKEMLYNVVRAILVVCAYFGFGLQMYVVMDMLWPAIRRKLPRCNLERWHLPLEYVFRVVLVSLTFGLGILIPKLERIIPLVGVTMGMLIAFMFPPFIECVTFWEKWKMEESNLKLSLRILKNTILALMGLFGLVAGLYANAEELLGKKLT